MFKKGFSTILIVVIVLVVIAGGVLTWQYWPVQQVTIEEDCTEEGGIECNVLGCNPCCGSLEDRDVLTIVDMSGELTCVEEMAQQICVNCGDGICGIGEDWCICPEDCEEPNDIDIFSNWENYRNPQLGFSIKYLPDWEKSEILLGTGTKVSFFAPNEEAVVWVRVGSYYDQIEAREKTLDELISDMKISYEVLKDENIFINSIPARKLSLLWSKERPGYLIFMQREGERNIIEIMTEIRNIENQDKYSSILNQMLFTFRFIDIDENTQATQEEKTDETADWKTITNIYGYNVRYPANVTVIEDGMGEDINTALIIVMSHNSRDQAFRDGSFFLIDVVPDKASMAYGDMTLEKIARANYEANQANTGVFRQIVDPMRLITLDNKPAYTYTIVTKAFSGKWSGWPLGEKAPKKMKIIELENDGRYFLIAYLPDNPISEQVFSTFKFVD